MSKYSNEYKKYKKFNKILNLFLNFLGYYIYKLVYMRGGIYVWKIKN